MGPEPQADDPVFRTSDHPEANGRTPRLGEQEWRLHFPLEDGRTLWLNVGTVGHHALRDMLIQEMTDDEYGL